MAIEKSFFDFDEISKVLLQQYGVKTKKINVINRGSANIYEIHSEKEQYIMKEFQKKISIDNVQTEYNVVNHLKKYNINTPIYCKNKEKQICFLHKDRIVILQEFISGNVCKPNSSNKEQIMEAVVLLARIIQALEEYYYQLPYFKRYIMSKEICDNDISNIEQLMLKINDKDINNKLKEKIRILLKLRNKNFEWQEKLTIKKSHGDFNVSQFIYNKDGQIKAILDFVATRNIPISREIIRNYFFMAKEIKNKEIDFDFFIKYVKKFMETYELNYYDLKYMPLLYLIELSRTTYGYEQYANNQSEEYLEIGNQLYNQCICLEKNYNELSKRLMELLKKG